jgi:hypothetical protein
MKEKLKQAYTWFGVLFLLGTVVGSLVYTYYKERQQWRYRDAVIELAGQQRAKK